MLSKEDNELICRVGPETPMGKAMRHFWVPALLSSELPERDGDPVHVELLGESLVAFRDSNGNVGLLDEYCSHRGASLTIGRVENCGLRCIYHGWLFAADGTILETPNVTDPRLRERHKAKAYPVREAGGFIWAYLGSPENQPPLYQSSNFILFERQLGAVQGAYWMSNAELALGSADETWSLTAFVNNIENKRRGNNGYYNVFSGLVSTNYGPPRTYGLRAGFHF